MPRTGRIVLPGLPHHVTQRGNRRQQVFFSQDDYEAYLRFMHNGCRSFQLSLLSYCLMPNHVHLLLVPPTEAALREAVASIHQNYTRFINTKHGWKGHLWQGRFFSCAVQPQIAPIVARYIELNPVRAKLQEDPELYPWSSASLACRGGPDGRSGFGDIHAPQSSWRDFLQGGIMSESTDDIRRIRHTVSTGRPFSSNEFLKEMEEKTGLALLKKRPGRKAPSNLADEI